MYAKNSQFAINLRRSITGQSSDLASESRVLQSETQHLTQPPVIPNYIQSTIDLFNQPLINIERFMDEQLQAEHKSEQQYEEWEEQPLTIEFIGDRITKNMIDEPCAICYCDYKDETDCPIMMHQCTHVFHESCILKWGEARVEKQLEITCPMCRL